MLADRCGELRGEWASPGLETALSSSVMAARRTATPVIVPDGELESAVLGVVEAESSVTGVELRKKLDKRWKGSGERAVAVADGLADRGRLFRLSSAKKVHYFHQDPVARLPELVIAALQGGALSLSELSRAVERKGKGLGSLINQGWVKQALRRGDLFQVPAAPGSKSRVLSLEPDAATFLSPVLVALRKVLLKRDAARIPRGRLLAEFAAALGLATTDTRPESSFGDGAEDEERLLRTLDDLGSLPGAMALLSVREVRARAGLDKSRFDRAVLSLSHAGAVVLHHHDFPSSLSEQERAELVVDERGTHYVGIARRAGR